MKKSRKILSVVVVAVLIILTVMTGCANGSEADKAGNNISGVPTGKDVLQALLDPNMIYTDDRIDDHGMEAYKITTEYLKHTEPDLDVISVGQKWQLPNGYVLHINDDRSAYLTTFPIEGRKGESDPLKYETRLLWTNIDKGIIDIPHDAMDAVCDRNFTFSFEYDGSDDWNVFAWHLGEKTEISIPNIKTFEARFVDPIDDGYFYFGTPDMDYSEYSEGVFFENANELYFLYELDGKYEAKLLASDFAGSFTCAASSIYYVNTNAELVQLDVYGNMEKIEKTVIGKNVFSLHAYAGNVTWQELKSDKPCKPERYVLKNYSVPFGYGA